MASPAPDTFFDKIIVGGGLSGINIAYHVNQTQASGESYAVFEARNSLGGTWDLFRYPGIRTDSDVYTFSYAWNPVPADTLLASGPDVRNYIRQSAKKFGIDKHVYFLHKTTAMNWDSKTERWALTVTVGEGKIKIFHARFVVLATGYYDYEKPLSAIIPGIDDFKGVIVHPQFWPENLDYSGKEVVIIGSGATAITLLPAMTPKAKRVVMLQRSPTFIVNLPSSDIAGTIIRWLMPLKISAAVNRFRMIFWHYVFFYYCTWFPRSASRAIINGTAKQLPPRVPWNPHFKPVYNPWQQRVCFSPDGDFFASLRSGRGGIVTGAIKNVTEDEIQMQNGEILKPDIIVTATGLALKIGGGINITIDGEEIDIPSRFLWRGCLIQDVPNFGIILGYFNAPFTLGAEVSAQLLNRLFQKMKSKGATTLVPKLRHPMADTPISVLNSTYIKAAAASLPRVGSGVWAPRWNYVADLMTAKYGDVCTDLDFSKDRAVA